MELNKAILKGIECGVNRHWRYTKNLVRVKPEYLLTVSVADQLSKGFGNVNGLDVEIKLEEPTHLIVGHIWMEAVGWSRYHKERVPWQGRQGNIDILLEYNNERHMVELKNFNPDATAVKKEISRFRHMFEINSGVNSLKSCHLAFPSTTNKESWLRKQANKNLVSDKLLEYIIASKYFVTNEDPDDGLPAYYSTVLSFIRKQPHA